MRLADPLAHTTSRAALSIVAAIAAAIAAAAPGAEEGGTTLSPRALQEIAQVEAEIDAIEARSLERLATLPDNQIQQIELLGKLMLYDKDLSVNRNEAYAFANCTRTSSMYNSSTAIANSSPATSKRPPPPCCCACGCSSKRPRSAASCAPAPATPKWSACSESTCRAC